MKNFKKDYKQPIFSIITAPKEDVLVTSDTYGMGDYNINWLGKEEEF